MSLRTSRASVAAAACAVLLGTSLAASAAPPGQPIDQRISLRQSGFDLRPSAIGGVSQAGQITAASSGQATALRSSRTLSMTERAAAPVPHPDPWDFSLTGTFGYNSNATQDFSNTDSPFGTAEFVASYRFSWGDYIKEDDAYPTQLVVSYDIGGSFYKGELAGLDQIDHTIDALFQTVAVTRTDARPGLVLNVDAKGTLSQFDFKTGVLTFEITPSATVAFNEDFTVQVAYTFINNNYRDAFGADDNRHSVGATLAHKLPKKWPLHGEFGLGYTHTWDEANGPTGDFDSDQVSVGFRGLSWWNTDVVHAGIDVNYTLEWRDYRNTTGPTPGGGTATRDDTIGGFTAQLNYTFGPGDAFDRWRHKVYLVYTYADDDANLAQAGFSRWKVAAGYVWRF